MKAWVLHGINDLRYETVGAPTVSAHEVLVSVKAAGICGSDIPRIYQTGAHVHPLTPGHEFAGVVTGIGEDVDENWMGARVGVFPLIPCNVCVPCKKKQYEMCRNYSYLGSRRDGGFAEFVAVPVGNLIRLPDNVAYEEAAMLEPMAVAVHAMRKTAPSESECIVICGLGTIGLFLLMFLLESGRKNILAIGNKEFQRQMAVRMGLQEECYCDSKSQDVDKWISERTGGLGADVFFECVGRNETLTWAIRATRAAGRVMLVGNPAADMMLEKEVYWKILRNQLTVMGTWNSSFTHEPEDDWHYVLDRLYNRRIAPEELITHKFSLENLYKGFEIMRDKSEEYGKIMGISAF